MLEPFFNNELKRLIKTPKLYFCDTGLCAYLSMWTSRDTNQKEIDLVIEKEGKLHPIEIKRTSNPEKKTIRS